MKTVRYGAAFLGILLGAACVSVSPAIAQSADPQYSPTQDYPPQQQYPPSGQYPQQQYPPSGQYPPAQYPPQQQYPQQQYPQGQYPPPQGQYPASQAPPSAYGQPPLLPPQQLDQLVEPIALYPDGLLAQVLTASTMSIQIPDAARWANEHAYLRGRELADAMRADNLQFDPSVMALLPFPNVLNYMAQYSGWTQQLGNAVLVQRSDVMDSVQHMRQLAYDYGYLRSGPYYRVSAGPGDIEILPVTPDAYYVPYYDPRIVYYRPRPGFYVGGAIRFGPAVTVGVGFDPWGWGNVGFGWHDHTILVDHRPWDRSWANRQVYVHPYAEPYRHDGGPRVEHHDMRVHSEREHHDRDRR